MPILDFKSGTPDKKAWADWFNGLVGSTPKLIIFKICRLNYLDSIFSAGSNPKTVGSTLTESETVGPTVGAGFFMVHRGQLDLLSVSVEAGLKS